MDMMRSFPVFRIHGKIKHENEIPKGRIDMIEDIKNKLWSLLEDKSVSLAMIYSRDGEILWHRGRRIVGRNVAEGQNFCKSFVQVSMTESQRIHKDNVGMLLVGDGLSESAQRLMIKSILILPVDDDFFLYVDSGVKVHFSEAEQAQFQVLADLMQTSAQKIRRSEGCAGGVCGESEAIQRIKNLMLKFAIEEECVLLLGETGAGKSFIAEKIHEYSGRGGRFVVADTTVINENLFESIVFGHKKGAFTSATEDRRGLVDEAAGGTLFFDEVAEVPLSFQVKLLRFMETKKYRVLGDTREKEADVRIIAATNRNLPELIREKQFREDLYYRLNILEIAIPPLRERLGDIESLVRENLRFLKGKETGEGFWETMLNHSWPGNVRELFTVMKRLGILCESPIRGEDVMRILSDKGADRDTTAVCSRTDEIWLRMKSGENFWTAVKEPFLDRHLNRVEVKAILERALILAGGKYVDTLPLFNLDKSEYKPFMRFVNHNKF
ncbi:MAG: sigma-54-dependent Fis family transcriptional regulator [Candidatus Aureabacteria bacterium]|nr:sigma-54-dependent Fis family transcriptional regulator [Candidatus Auribacterota bacterium]